MTGTTYITIDKTIEQDPRENRQVATEQLFHVHFLKPF